jgi:hypothetical protein
VANKVRLRIGKPVSYLAVVGGICKWMPARVATIVDPTHVTLKTKQGVNLNGSASTLKHTGTGSAVNVWRSY